MNAKRRKEVKDCIKDLDEARMLAEISKGAEKAKEIADLVRGVGITLEIVIQDEEIAIYNMEEYFPLSDRLDRMQECKEALQELHVEFQDTLNCELDDFLEDWDVEEFVDSIDDFKASLSDVLKDL